ncbi:alpha/beta fold hydrolase [Rhizobacter sp. Root1221]|uniref:alpha/beta fold hydrolase n=1 Tax=Rhizobacter sp. Root1221 TaxID=1736433 RepID=UPI0006F81CBF|nr:alpha/beta hydrolase [Rhizobacter sp. Root1221]KQV99345.1 alpha/beta hydrolase [Rhizobacter sp. Root1221]
MNAPVLVFLPGLLCDEAVWNAQCRDLTQVRCEVASFGLLSSITAMAQQVLAHTKAPRFSLAGHSMGGRVALEMMRLAPHRIERLALLDTGMDPLAPGEAGAVERAQRMALLKLAQQEGMRAMGRQWAQGMVHPSRRNTPLFDAVLDMIGRKTPAIFEAQIEALLARPDARPVLKDVDCPVLLLCGRQDAWSPLWRHEQMHELIPGSRLAVVEEAGHMTTMEAPARVSLALAAWLLQAPVH